MKQFVLYHLLGVDVMFKAQLAHYGSKFQRFYLLRKEAHKKTNKIISVHNTQPQQQPLIFA